MEERFVSTHRCGIDYSFDLGAFRSRRLCSAPRCHDARPSRPAWRRDSTRQPRQFPSYRHQRRHRPCLRSLNWGYLRWYFVFSSNLYGPCNYASGWFCLWTSPGLRISACMGTDGDHCKAERRQMPPTFPCLHWKPPIVIFFISKPTYRRSWRSTCQLSCNPGLVRCSSPRDEIWCTSKDRTAWRTFWSTWGLSIDIQNSILSLGVPVHLRIVHVVRHGVFWGEIRIGRHFLRRVDDRGLHHRWFWKSNCFFFRNAKFYL